MPPPLRLYKGHTLPPHIIDALARARLLRKRRKRSRCEEERRVLLLREATVKRAALLEADDYVRAVQRRAGLREIHATIARARAEQPELFYD